MKKILPFFSYLFHPIFIPILGTAFYIVFGDNYLAKEKFHLLLLQVIIILFFLPLSFFYLLKTFGKVDTIMLSDTSQRKIPLLLQMALTTILISKSVSFERFPELFFFFLGSIGSAIIAFALLYANLKISIHMIAMSALSFFIIGMSQHFHLNCISTIAMLFVVTGIVATSRLFMKAHTMEELIIGYVAGMAPQMVVWIFWL